MKIRLFFISWLTVLSIQFSVLASVYYVDIDSPATSPDGSSWAAAYTSIQDAIDAASTAGGGEVWVANGTYTITTTVTMKSDVSIYGGFSGDESVRSERDWETYPVVIDAGGSTRVMEADNADNVVIDGFTLTGGDARNAKRSAQRRTTTPSAILSSEGGYGGGGILIWQCAPAISNCIFDDNIGVKGGAAYIVVAVSESLNADPEDAPVFTDCFFTNNYATLRGGAVSCDLMTHPTFDGCTFANNSTDAKGGGMYLDWKCSPSLTNCLFYQNTAERAGAIGCDGNSSPTLVNCTITNNTAYDIGAGLYTGSYSSTANTPTLVNCIVWGNNNVWGGPEDFTPWHENQYIISYSYIGNGFISYGDGVITDDATDPDLSTLFNGPDNDDYRHVSGSVCIDVGTSAGDDIPSDDIDDNTRDSAPDLGAYEYTEIASGSLTVEISPKEAVIAGASWSIDGGATWYDDGETVTLDADDYTVTLSTINGYDTPSNSSVTIANGGSETVSATYTDQNTYTDAFKGYTLYMPFTGTEVYLIDNYGNTVHSWDSGSRSALSVYLLDNGNLLQTVDMNNSTFDEAGAGGRVIEIAPDGTIEWQYDYSSDQYVLHHDIEYMSNGNILMVAWEFISYDDAVAAGRDPSYVSESGLYSDMIIEVEPAGSTTGEIVWKWRVWDHLVQEDYNSKDNYATVADHPELIDLNYVTTNPDYTHFNSIDYNEELDQVLVSVKRYNEIWVIDHSTTTEEAAGHSGGNNGKGGDIVYRWGNPAAYDAGDSTDQKLYGQHDANWIDSGYPGEGNILIFNNGEKRPGSTNYSSVEEITPPVDENGEYSLTTGEAYEPSSTTWTYNIDSAYYSFNISGAQRLPNGNTLICSGANGYFMEVDADDNTVWEYTVDGSSNVFKIRRYGVDFAGLAEIVDTGTLSVSITPTEAVTAGAQWNINDGEWHDSDESVTVAIGTHTLSFNTVDGYDAPDDQTVDVTSASSESISAAYSETGQTTGLFQTGANADDGYILFSPTEGDGSYLMDHDGNFGQTWDASGTSRRIDSSTPKPLPVAYLLENGNLLRTSYIENAVFKADGAGGLVQEFGLDNSMEWEYSLSNDQYCLHHDVKYMPNGNILMAVWEYKSDADAVTEGRDPNLLPSGGLWPDMIIEVEPDRVNSGGTIVWEWHVWDHLIQDEYPDKNNYGTVSDHPELIDINYVDTPEPDSDWTHVNSIDYRADLDQILISANGFNEVWVIDHSTTTAEAAGHSGGTYGKGGDLLYRWGNPSAHGVAAPQILYKQHDATWIDPDCPGADNILIFNNGETYSAVIEITPPMDAGGNYILGGDFYGPTEFTWFYTDPNPTDFFAPSNSSAQRLPNGNTLICNGYLGIFFEVTYDKEIVWKYVNPVSRDQILGPNDAIPEENGERLNQVFKIRRYSRNYAGLPDNLRADFSSVIKLLKILTRRPTEGDGFYDADNDNTATPADVIYLLHELAGLY